MGIRLPLYVGHFCSMMQYAGCSTTGCRASTIKVDLDQRSRVLGLRETDGGGDQYNNLEKQRKKHQAVRHSGACSECCAQCDAPRLISGRKVFPEFASPGVSVTLTYDSLCSLYTSLRSCVALKPKEVLVTKTDRKADLSWLRSKRQSSATARTCLQTNQTYRPRNPVHPPSPVTP